MMLSELSAPRARTDVGSDKIFIYQYLMTNEAKDCVRKVSFERHIAPASITEGQILPSPAAAHKSGPTSRHSNASSLV